MVAGKSYFHEYCRKAYCRKASSQILISGACSSSVRKNTFTSLEGGGGSGRVKRGTAINQMSVGRETIIWRRNDFF